MKTIKVGLGNERPINFFAALFEAGFSEDVTDTLGAVKLVKVFDPAGKEVDFRSVQVGPKDGQTSIRGFILADTHGFVINIDHQRGVGKTVCPDALHDFCAEFELVAFNANRQVVPKGILG